MALDYKKEYFRYRRYFLESFTKSKKHQALWMLILSIFTVSFFSAFAIRPTIKTIVELNRRIQDEREVDKKLGEKIASLQIAQEEYEKIQPDLPLIYEVLPTDPALYPLVKAFETIATQSAVTDTSLNFQSVNLIPGASGSAEISFNLSASGSYDSLLSYLDSLEKVRRVVVWENASIKPPKETAEANSGLVLTINGKAYVLGREAPNEP